MSIDFSKTFGANRAAPAAAGNSDRPKAKFWLNVGYSVPVTYSDPVTNAITEETKFVSLPVGIPFDTMEKITVTSRNDEYAALQTAQNDLHDQIMAAVNSMKPGETQILNLEIQVRRINEDRPAIAPEQNAFVRKLDLVG